MLFLHDKHRSLLDLLLKKPALLAVSFIASRSSFRTTVRGKRGLVLSKLKGLSLSSGPSRKISQGSDDFPYPYICIDTKLG
jgi:hypothetical protein